MIKNTPRSVFFTEKLQVIIPIMLAVFAFYLIFHYRAQNINTDGCYYLYKIKTTQGNIDYPPHVVYGSSAYMVYLGISSIFKSCDILFAVQLHNTGWAVLTILLLYLALRHLTASIFRSLIGAVCLLFTQGFWSNSTSADIGMAQTGSLMPLLFYLIIKDKKNISVLVTSLLLAFSILYHQSNILICIPLVYFFIATRNKEGFKILLKVLLISGAIVLSIYVLFYNLLEINKRESFIRYIFAYAYTPSFETNWGLLSNFSYNGILMLITSQLYNFVFIPYDLLAPSRVMFAIGILVFLICCLISASVNPENRKVNVFLLIWLLTHWLFVLWWIPYETQYFLTPIIPMILLASMMIKDEFEKIKKAKITKAIIIQFLLVAVFSMGIINFSKTILPRHNSKGRQYFDVCALNNTVPKKYAIAADYSITVRIKHYFSGRKTLMWPDHILLLFYKHMMVPRNNNIYKKCVAMELKLILPETITYGFSPYEHPSEYMKYIEWLFNCKYDSGNRPIGCRRFEVVKSGTNTFFILLDESAIEIDGFEDLFKKLDKRINIYKKNKDMFQNWYNCAYLKKTL